MKIAGKPYETRGMVELDRTRTNFDTTFRSRGFAYPAITAHALGDLSEKGCRHVLGSGVQISKLASQATLSWQAESMAIFEI